MRMVFAITAVLFWSRAGCADAIPVTISPDDAADSSTSLSGGDDPEWTTASNIALTDSLLALVTTLGGNSADIGALFQPGAALAGDAVVSTPVISVTGSSGTNIPEPATIGLPIAGLLLLMWYAARRVRVIRQDASTDALTYPFIDHGPLHRSD